MQEKDNTDFANSNYIGISFVALKRVESLVQSSHFLSRNFCESEQALCRQAIIPSYSYAQFLAAKLACLKALNIDFCGQYKLCNIELMQNDSGELSIKLQGKLDFDTRLMGIEKLLVSLSKNEECAIATVACVTKYNKQEIVEEISIKDELNAAFKDLRHLLQ